MEKVNKSYKIINVKNKKNYNRILGELRKIKELSDINLNKDQHMLHVGLLPTEETGVPQIEAKIQKALQRYEKTAGIEEFEVKESVRKVLILKGIDCGHCATRIENLARKTFSHEKLVVDFATERFIIETTDLELGENILPEVTKLVHKIDPNIQVIDSKTKKRVMAEEVYKIKKSDIILFFIGVGFLLLSFVYIPKLHIDGIRLFAMLKLFFKGQEYELSHYSKITLLLAFLFIGNKVILQFVRNLFTGRIFDENFLMTTASIGAIFTEHNIEAVMVMMFYQIGSFLQQRAVNHSRKSITELLSFEATTAKLKLGSDVTEVEVESVLPGDIILVKTGEMIPLDGVIVEGKTYLDTKALTGESLNRSAKPGSEVLSGMINMGGVIEVKVTKASTESTMSKIIEMVENASTKKAKAEEFISKFARYYTPIVSACALLIAVFPLIVRIFDSNSSLTLTDSVYRAMIFLVISCPCALVISIPLSFFAGIGIASKRGILIKGSNYLEALNNVEQVVFDKTGTLTKGEFGIKEVVPMNPGTTAEELHRLVAYGEYYSTHPIGISIVDEYGRDRIFPEIIAEFTEFSGRGLKATINGARIMVGNSRLMKENKFEVPKVDKPGMILHVTKERTYLGYVVVGDVIRDEAVDTIRSLRKRGVKKIHLLTGDAKGVAESVANALDIDDVYSELLPNEKVEKLNEIRALNTTPKSKTIYIGDGINDAPVISSADVGIAMGATGSDAAIAIADVVIMSDNLQKVDETLAIAKKTRQLVVQNITLSLGIKIFVLLLGLFGTVTIWLAIFSDVGVSLLAILNAMRVMGLYKHQTETVEEQEV